MKTIKLSDRIVALDQIAMVEHFPCLQENLHQKRTAIVTLKTREQTKVSISAPSELSNSYVSGDILRLRPGQTVTPIEGGNIFFWVTQPDYEKLVWALESWEGEK